MFCAIKRPLQLFIFVKASFINIRHLTAFIGTRCNEQESENEYYCSNYLKVQRKFGILRTIPLNIWKLGRRLAVYFLIV
jgi:hypothetical protein